MSDYPIKFLWVVGGEQHAEELTSAAEWVHANAHLDAPPGSRPDRGAPCADCWRAAAFAIKGFLLAGFAKNRGLAEAPAAASSRGR